MTWGLNDWAEDVVRVLSKGSERPTKINQSRLTDAMDSWISAVGRQSHRKYVLILPLRVIANTYIEAEHPR